MNDESEGYLTSGRWLERVDKAIDPANAAAPEQFSRRGSVFYDVRPVKLTAWNKANFIVNGAVDASTEIDLAIPVGFSGKSPASGDYGFVVWRGRWELIEYSSRQTRAAVVASVQTTTVVGEFETVPPHIDVALAGDQNVVRITSFLTTYPLANAAVGDFIEIVFYDGDGWTAKRLITRAGRFAVYASGTLVSDRVKQIDFAGLTATAKLPYGGGVVGDRIDVSLPAVEHKILTGGAGVSSLQDTYRLEFDADDFGYAFDSSLKKATITVDFPEYSLTSDSGNSGIAYLENANPRITSDNQAGAVQILTDVELVDGTLRKTTSYLSLNKTTKRLVFSKTN